MGVLSGLGETRIRIGERGIDCCCELLIRIGLYERDNDYSLLETTIE